MRRSASAGALKALPANYSEIEHVLIWIATDEYNNMVLYFKRY
jgi:hypothetical protein